MGKKNDEKSELPATDRQRPIAFKAVLPWEDLVSLKKEAIERGMTIGDIIREALHGRMILIDKTKKESK